MNYTDAVREGNFVTFNTHAGDTYQGYIVCVDGNGFQIVSIDRDLNLSLAGFSPSSVSGDIKCIEKSLINIFNLVENTMDGFSHLVLNTTLGDVAGRICFADRTRVIIHPDGLGRRCVPMSSVLGWDYYRPGITVCNNDVGWLKSPNHYDNYNGYNLGQIVQNPFKFDDAGPGLACVVQLTNTHAGIAYVSSEGNPTIAPIEYERMIDTVQYQEMYCKFVEGCDKMWKRIEKIGTDYNPVTITAFGVDYSGNLAGHNGAGVHLDFGEYGSMFIPIYAITDVRQ